MGFLDNIVAKCGFGAEVWWGIWATYACASNVGTYVLIQCESVCYFGYTYVVCANLPTINIYVVNFVVAYTFVLLL